MGALYPRPKGRGFTVSGIKELPALNRVKSCGALEEIEGDVLSSDPKTYSVSLCVLNPGRGTPPGN